MSIFMGKDWRITRSAKRALLWMVLAWPVSLAAEGQHHPTARWQQIELDHFVVIFAEGHEAEARRVAAYLDTYLPAMADTLHLPHPWGRFPVVLSSSTHESNGYVGLGQRRSYLYNKPLPMHSAEWLRSLTIHEGRHTQQFSKPMETLAGRMLYVLLGEMGPGALLMFTNPLWFLEGDAVLEETLWTPGGRGRVPAFDLWRRTHELEGNRDSYHRAYLGTGRDPYPSTSFYDVGYLLVTYFRRHYGDDFFGRVLDNRGFWPRSVNGQIRRLTGHDIDYHYQQMMDEMRQQWQAQQNALTITEAVQPLPRPETPHWLGYYPLGAEHGRVLALQWGVQQAPYLSYLNTDREHRLGPAPGLPASGYLGHTRNRRFSYADNQLCWVREHRHPRFRLQAWGDIRCLNLANKNQRDLSHRRHYNAMAISASGKMAAAEFTPDRQAAIDWLDNHGQRRARWPLPYNSYAFDLHLSAEGNSLLFSQIDDRGVGLYEMDLGTGTTLTLVAPSHDQMLRSPVYAGDWIAYNSDYTGTDQIWLINRQTLARHLAIQRPYGAYFPTWDEDNRRLVFTDYTADGDQLLGYPLPDAPLESEYASANNWLPLADVDVQRTDYFAPLLTDRHTDLADLSDQELRGDSYAVRPYRPSGQQLRPHSWSFGAIENELLGYTRFDDVLDRLSIEAMAGFYSDPEESLEDQVSGRLTVQYRRWYPAITTDIGSLLVRQRDSNDTLEAWRRSEVGLELSLPLGWRSNLMMHSAEPYAGISWLQQELLLGAPQGEREQPYRGALLRIGARYRSDGFGAFWDERSRRGWRADVSWQESMSGPSDFDWRGLQGHFGLALPGLMPNQAARVQLALERQSGASDDFYLASLLPGARGYSEALSKREGGVLSGDLRLPLVTVDHSLFGALYVQRLALEISGDLEMGRVYEESWRKQRSVGTTLIAPSYPFNNRALHTELQFGIFHRLDAGGMGFRFGLGMEL